MATVQTGVSWTSGVSSSHGLRLRVRAVAQALSGFLRGSETVFLETGAALQALEKRALTLVRGSADATANDDAVDPARRLDRQLQEVHLHLDGSRTATRQASDRLGQLVNQIKDFSVEGRAFEELATSLRVLGVLTRVENARGGYRLDNVGEDVRRLSARLASTFDGVLEGALALGERARSARARSEAFLSQQGQRSRTLLMGARSSIEQLEALSAAASELVAKAGRTSQCVSDEVKGVVVQLQMHDTTRQMIEHVKEELEELEADGALTESEFRAELEAMCLLEEKQLGFARAQLSQALLRISQALRTLSTAVGGLAEETGGLAGNRQGDSLLDSVERCIADTTRLLREQLTLEHDLDAALLDVGQTVKAIVGCVADIESVGAAVRLLALNGIVQTAHVGTDRAVFAALAGQMSSISQDVAERSLKVTRRLEAIDAEARLLQSGEAGELSAQVQKCGVLVAELEEFLVSMVAYHHAVSSRVDALLKGSLALTDEVKQLSKRLEREAAGLAALEALEAELSRLGREAHASTGGVAGPRSSRRLEAAKARYTMESERQVHRELAPAPAVAEEAPEAQADREFGDNVELF
jgi:hypothetical protein